MASSTSPGPAPGWFKVAAIVAILWNVMGIGQCASAVGLFGDPLATLGPAERAAAATIPSWIYTPFALGTITGLIGSLGLFLRRRWAFPLLIVSLVALWVLEGWMVFFSGILEAFGGIAFPLTIAGVALLLAWLAFHARKQGWLR